MAVYMIQAGENGPVKIGKAERPALRLREIQRLNHAKLRIIRLFEGGRAEERRLHQIFAAFRMHGEWFELTSLMLRGNFGLTPISKNIRNDAHRSERPGSKAIVFGPDKQARLPGLSRTATPQPLRSGPYIRTKKHKKFVRLYCQERAKPYSLEQPSLPLPSNWTPEKEAA